MYPEYVGKAKNLFLGGELSAWRRSCIQKSSVVNLNPSNTSKLIHHLSKDTYFHECLVLLRKSVGFKVLRIGFVNI